MLDELFKDIIVEVIKERQREKTAIGFISEDLRKEYVAWRDEKEELEAEIKFRMERLKAKLEKQLQEEFEPKFEESNLAKKSLWNRIRNELNIADDDVSLNIDPKTGVISQWHDEE